MAHSKWLLLAVLISLFLSACGDTVPSVTTYSPQTTPTPIQSTTAPSLTATTMTVSPVQTQPVSTTVFATTASPTTPLNTLYVIHDGTTAPPPPPIIGSVYLAETFDGGISWSPLITQTNPLKEEYSGFENLNCISIKTCTSLKSDSERRTVFLDLVREGAQNWKSFFTSSSSHITCLSLVDCWEIVYNGLFNGIWVTHDGGSNWENYVHNDQFRVNASNEPIYLKARRNESFGSEIAFTHSISCVTSSRCLLLGNGGRSIRTLDGGQNWDWFFIDPAFYYDSQCLDSQTCYAYGRDYFAITEDFGETWRRLTVPSDIKELTGFSCVSATECTVIGSGNKIITTHDKGVSWNEFTANLPQSHSLQDISCPVSQVCYAISTDSTLWATQDGGKTWIRHSIALTNFKSYFLRIGCPTATNCLITNLQNI